jgi:predicted aldo/keto reductase-like oxidoreductase
VEYRTLGRTGLKLSTVGFGCMLTSDGSVIRKALDMGINHFDTARAYLDGNNEELVGEAIKGRRQQIVLSSKSIGGSNADIMRNLGLSLAALKTDYLDIWYMHGLAGAGDITPGMLNAIRTAKRSGMVRFAGVSTHMRQAAVIKDALKTPDLDVVLVAYNFAMEQGLTPLIEQAAKAGVGVIAMKVFAGGFRSSTPYQSPGKLRKMLRNPGAMLSALKWVVGNPNVTSAIPSIVDTDQLEENFKAMSEPFGEEDVKRLTAQLEYIRPLYCRMCGRCDGDCARGVPVQDVLRALTYAEGYGQLALGRETFRALPSNSACSGCPGCTVRCPQGVEVAARMQRAQELLA